jgi:1,4-dihydroxy-2-naphthoate octaprenyltransferase
MPSPAITARALFETSRPSQLLLICGVYALGAKIALANGATISGPELAAGVVALVPIAASVHYANEYADYETDALTDRTPFSGGSGALHRAGLPRTVALRAAIVTLAVGLVLTAVLVGTGRLALPAVALLSIIAVLGWQYSVPPLRLAWRGWGELDNSFLGGLVLPVYGGAVAGGSIRTVALASVPFFLVVFLNLLATQWPDRNADAAVGKRTLAVKLPPRWLRVIYVGVAAVAGLSLFVLAPRVLPWPVVGASLVVAPILAWGAIGYTRRHVPWPTVTAMVGLATLQFLAWCWVGL